MKLVSILLYFSFVYCNFEVPYSCNAAGQIALTFDDGPSLYTGELLKSLEKDDVKVAFHIKTDYLSNPVLLAYVRSAIQQGHIIGISLTQSDIRGATNSSIREFVEERTSRILKLTNYKVQFVRIPYLENGVPDMIYHTLVEEMGLTLSSFNLDSQDYTKGSSDFVVQAYRNILDRIVPPAKGSFISVQRDIIQESVDQTSGVIKYLTDKGYSILRLDSCIGKAAPKTTAPGNDGTKAGIPGAAISGVNSTLIPGILHLLCLFLIFLLY